MPGRRRSGLPAGCLWLELSILRGALQGVGDYKSVGLSLIGEQGFRLVIGAALAAVGLGVTGAYLGSPLSFVAMRAYCVAAEGHVEAETGESLRAGPASPAALGLWTHVRRAWAPIAGLIIIAVLQNIDIIAAKHRFTTSMASSYSAVAVAAKVLIWVAIGAGFYLVPEVSRRRAEGRTRDRSSPGRWASSRVCAVPVLLIYAFGSHTLIKARSGPTRPRRRARCSCSGWRSPRWPAPTWRSSTCWRCTGMVPGPAGGSWRSPSRSCC